MAYALLFIQHAILYSSSVTLVPVRHNSLTQADKVSISTPPSVLQFAAHNKHRPWRANYTMLVPFFFRIRNGDTSSNRHVFLLLFFMLIFSIFYLATAVARTRSRLCALPTCFTRCSSPSLFHMADPLYVRLIQPSQYPSRSVLAAYSYHCFHIQLLSHTIYFILFDTNPGPH